MSARKAKAARRTGAAISIDARRAERAFEIRAHEVQVENTVKSIVAEALGIMRRARRVRFIRRGLAWVTLAAFVGAMILLFALAVFQ